MSKSREIHLKELLSYNLSDYPLSLSTTVGSLVKTAKSKMIEILDGTGVDPTVDAENVGDHNELIVDALAVLQAMKEKWQTFGEFADTIFAYLVKHERQWKATRLDFVSSRMQNAQKGLCKVSRESIYSTKINAFQPMEEVHELWQEQRVIDCVFM
jgi:hypothetical protein